jgi:hypothetical protein
VKTPRLLPILFWPRCEKKYLEMGGPVFVAGGGSEECLARRVVVRECLARRVAVIHIVVSEEWLARTVAVQGDEMVFSPRRV